MELAENQQVCSNFKVMASLVEENIHIENINLREVWKIANTIFVGDVWEIISDVNHAVPVNHICRSEPG